MTRRQSSNQWSGGIASQPAPKKSEYNQKRLSGLKKLELRARKCNELRGEYVEQIPSLVAVACFLPGRAKELLAPPRKIWFQLLLLPNKIEWRVTFIKIFVLLWQYLAQFFLQREMFQTKIVEKIKTHILRSIPFFVLGGIVLFMR